MAQTHSLEDCDLGLMISGNNIERVRVSKLLGVQITSHLKWDEHICILLKSCYGILRTLREFKHFADFKLRKHLVETLILTKIDYCDVVFYPIPKFLLGRLQRLQFTAAGFITGRYFNSFEVLLKLGWLPIKKRRDFSILKHTFKAMNNPW